MRVTLVGCIASGVCLSLVHGISCSAHYKAISAYVCFIMQSCYFIFIFGSSLHLIRHFALTHHLPTKIMATQLDVGDQGTIQVLSRHPHNKCIAKITYNTGCSLGMQSYLDVIIVSENTTWEEGASRILAKFYDKRECTLEIRDANPNMQPFMVTWHLDEPTAALQLE